MTSSGIRLITGVGLLVMASCGPEPGGQGQSPLPGARKEAARMALEADALDRSLWSSEMDAQRHEAVIVRLWDRMRAAADPLVVLRDFPVGAIRVGELGKPLQLNNGVHVTRFSRRLAAEPVYLDRGKWSDLLLMLKNRGFQVVQSEWHHVRFVPAGDGEPARSEVSFEVHLNKAHPPMHALIAKGRLGIVWEGLASGRGDGEPVIKSVDASQIILVEREGEEGFERALRIAPEPEVPGGSVDLHPVMVYDLDGDGLPEIVLGGVNSVMQNRGGFRFEQGPLMAGEVALRNAGNIADFNGDGQVDLLGVNRRGEGVLVAGDGSAGFTGTQIKPWDVVTRHSSAMTCGDIDNDGDLDVWISQYRSPYVRGQMPTPFYDANDGYRSYLMLNGGDGSFTDATEAAGLAGKRHRRSYSHSLVDIDNDGDLDLLVVSDFSGLDIYTNDGRGRFKEVTGEFVTARHAFGMSHAFGDFDRDGRPDIYMAGMSSTTARRLERLGLVRADFPDYSEMRGPMTFGNRLYQREGARFVQGSLNNNAARLGWTWGCAAADFDNDGDDDLYVANGHISGQSATDYCTRYWCHDLYTGTSSEDPGIAHLLSDEFRPQGMRGLNSGGISWNGYEKNRLLMNLSGRDFIDVGFLMGVGFEEDSRAVVAADLDCDGKQDLAVVATHWQPGPEVTPKQSLFLLRNRIPNGPGVSWAGVHLQGGRGLSPVGAQVTLESSVGRRSRLYVTGDSFYSQHPATVHFGLAAGERVKRILIRLPYGREISVNTPQAGVYHRVKL
jgi:hypothetical protein